MTFNNSCGYCALANMVESFGIDVEDRNICIEIGLPFLMLYDVRNDKFSIGTQHQNALFFNMYLESKGLYFVETEIQKKLIPKYLISHSNVMIGLSLSNKKHALVFLSHTNETYKFLNPHREDDKKADFLYFNEDELNNSLDEIHTIGYIIKIDETNKMSKFLHANTISTVHFLKTKLLEFIHNDQTKTEIIEKSEKLLRTLALDMYEMMKIVQEESIVKNIEIFRSEVIKLRNMNGSIKPIEHLNIENINSILKTYVEIVKKYIQ